MHKTLITTLVVFKVIDQRTPLLSTVGGLNGGKY